MKKQHILLIAAAAIGIILGTVIAVTAVLMATPEIAQPITETQTEVQTEDEVAPVDIQPVYEEEFDPTLTDAEFVKSMPEDLRAKLFAVVCLASDEGNTSEEIAESITNNIDQISPDYAQSFVDGALITLCPALSK